MTSAAPSPRWRAVFHAALATLVLLLALARFLPTTFNPPGAWQDEGWVVGINMALRGGLSCGRDFIFTYGPYGGISTRLLDPASLHMVLGGGALLSIAFTAGLVGLALDRPPLLLLLTLLLPLITYLDALAYALPLPALLLAGAAGRHQPLPARTRIAILCLLPALGLLPLIKGSILAVSLIAISVLSWLLWRARQPRLALAVPLGAALSLVTLWLCAGQGVAALGPYFLHAAWIIGGYNDAMAWPGPAAHAAREAAIAAGFLALMAWGVRRLPRDAAAALLAAAAGLAFVAFKAGYVRQDLGHEAITASALVLFFLLLAAWLRGAAAVLAGLAGLALLVGSSEQPARLPAAAVDGLRAELRGAVSLVTNPGAMARAETASLTPVPPLPGHATGTADIYSSGQTRLFNAGLAWSPRPVLQSYSAYTPGLAALNARHVLGPDAPDNVFFAPDPIDFRLPALEDGLSWPALLSRYDPVLYDSLSGVAWLRHNGQAALAAPSAPQLQVTPRLGETVTLPPWQGPLWAWIEPRPTLAGRAASALWRAPFINIRLDFEGGRSRVYRLIPGMSRAGFLLSPVVTSTLDFIRLRAPQGDQAALLNRPIAMALLVGHHGKWAWQRNYTLQLAPIALPPLRAKLAMQALSPVAQAPAPEIDAGVRCYVDDIGGSAVPPAPVPVSWPVRVNGWAVFDGPRHIGNESIALGFQARDGTLYAAQAAPIWRTDVAPIFQLPTAEGIGFTVEADTGRLPPGTYSVLVLPRRGSVARVCQTTLKLAVSAPP